MKIIAIIQARMGSIRLPGKSILDIAGKPLLEYVLMRVSRAETLHGTILAIPSGKENDPLCSVAQLHHIPVYRGSEEDVLSRYVEAARTAEADIVVRVCADNPLVDPGEIDRLVRHHIENNADYSFNNIPNKTNNYPDGLGVEVVNAKILYEIAEKNLTSAQKEHVTQYILDNVEEYNIESPVAPEEICGPEIKLDIDTESDFVRMKQFIENLPLEKKPFWGAAEIVREYRNFFQTKIVVLVETAEDIVAYQNFAQQAKGKIIVIATTPQASWDLESKNIPFKPIDKYHNEERIYNAGIENYEPLFQFCQSIDRKITDQNGMIKKNGLCPASDNFPVIKILYDALLIRTIILYEIIDQEKPELIVTFGLNGRNDQFQNNSLLPFTDEENIYHYLLELNGWPCKTLHLERCGQKSIGQHFNNGNNSLKRRVQLKIPKRFYFFIIPGEGLIENAITLYYVIKNRINNNKTLLLIGYAYDWNYMIPILLRKGYRIWPVSHPSCEIQEDFELGPSIISDNLVTELCCWNHVNFSPIFKRIFSRYVRNSISYASILSESWERIFSKIKPVAVLTGPRLSFTPNVPLHIAQFHNVPVLSWQHGAAGPHKAPILLFEELMNSDIHLCWGTGVLEWIKNDPQNYFKTQSVAVGSYDLEKMYFARDSPPRNFNVLYVTPSYFRNNYYVSIQYQLADTSFWNSQQKIIKKLGESNKKVKIRLSPAQKNEHIHDFISSRGYSNLNTDIEGFTYIDLTKRADIIIIDWPSTTLLQAIALRKTVFVLLKHIKLTDDAVRMLKKRAYCSENIDEFVEMIGRYFNNEHLDQNPDINNTEFLEMYGVAKLDGHVANRAIEILDDLIKYNR